MFVRIDKECKVKAAPAHISLLVCDFVTEVRTRVITEPLCSCILAPPDIFLFSKWKTTLKG